MGDKTRSSVIRSRSAEQPASPIESWMGSLANILKLLATAVLPLRDRQTSASGPGRVKISRNLGRTAHFSAAELLIRWNRPPVVSVASGSFM